MKRKIDSDEYTLSWSEQYALKEMIKDKIHEQVKYPSLYSENYKNLKKQLLALEEYLGITYMVEPAGRYVKLGGLNSTLNGLLGQTLQSKPPVVNAKKKTK
jgi:hypothetical protein